VYEPRWFESVLFSAVKKMGRQLQMLEHRDSLAAEDAAGLGRALRDLREKKRRVKAELKLRPRKRSTLKAEERSRVLEKTAGCCHICGGKIEESKWEADHVIAHSVGGEHREDNYLPAHSLCNNYRWDYLPEEFQLVMKIGVWCRKQIEDQTALGKDIASGFLKYERRRIGRHRKPAP
jgi:RNA polymerase-binding transcription factor DksA